MRFLIISTLALLATSAVGKKCINATVPVTITARTADFNVPIPHTNLDVTTFIQNNSRQGSNFTKQALLGYCTRKETYHISTQFCTPDEPTAASQTLQILTHGIGFDKTYWDLSYDNFNYSYVDVATDKHKYSTLSYDRLGIGKSSHGDPLNEIQAPLEVAALAELTTQLRRGTFPGVKTAFKKVVHIGHSFGSIQTYSLVNDYPGLSDGIVLTGFSMNSSFIGYFAAGANFVLANQNQPYRLGNGTIGHEQAVLAKYGLTDVVDRVSQKPELDYPDGYLVSSDAGANQYLFYLPPYFDQKLLLTGEATAKQPVTLGELLTLGSTPMKNSFAGPVLVITGSNDLPFCGGDCLATGNPALPNIPAGVAKSFPKVPPGDFEAYIQPHTGHGLNAHYNATAGYDVINEFLGSKL